MSQWIPVLLPKEVVLKLLKEYVIPAKTKNAYMEILKGLQNKAKAVKLFTGMTKQQTIKKLHQTRKALLKVNPDAYIDYSA